MCLNSEKKCTSIRTCLFQSTRPIFQDLVDDLLGHRHSKIKFHSQIKKFTLSPRIRDLKCVMLSFVADQGRQPTLISICGFVNFSVNTYARQISAFYSLLYAIHSKKKKIHGEFMQNLITPGASLFDQCFIEAIIFIVTSNTHALNINTLMAATKNVFSC